MSARQFRVKEFGKKNTKVVFFFAGMGTRTWMYKSPIKRMVASGFRVFAYDFDPLIVHKGTPDTYLQVIDEVLVTVKKCVELLKKEDVKEFSAFGFSMGTLTAIKSAAEIPELKKVVIMLTYGSVAENIWTWWFIRPAKRRAIKLGYSQESLDAKLAPLSPIPHASKLQSKKILLYIAHRDKIIRYKQSSKFVEALDAAHIKYTLIENKHFGHNISAAYNFSNYKTWLDFLHH